MLTVEKFCAYSNSNFTRHFRTMLFQFCFWRIIDLTIDLFSDYSNQKYKHSFKERQNGFIPFKLTLCFLFNAFVHYNANQMLVWWFAKNGIRNCYKCKILILWLFFSWSNFNIYRHFILASKEERNKLFVYTMYSWIELFAKNRYRNEIIKNSVVIVRSEIIPIMFLLQLRITQDLVHGLK